MNMDVRLPHSNKEGVIYGLVICSITVIILSSLNIYLQFQTFSSQYFIAVISAFPLFLIFAMVLENFFVGKIAHKLVGQFGSETDSFNAQIMFTIFFTVIGMSLIMSVVGDVFGHKLTIEPGIFKRFLQNWPRNFTVAFGTELLVAQPIARKVMRYLHR